MSFLLAALQTDKFKLWHEAKYGYGAAASWTE